MTHKEPTIRLVHLPLPVRRRCMTRRIKYDIQDYFRMYPWLKVAWAVTATAVMSAGLYALLVLVLVLGE